eukprot:TRINITY_DN3326_c1_g2_i1.p1 TRINITY_DN3326_c1_g2~~TRINITY_DN3326_c1_g2_i1.p1  ORF type:complete len:1301 (+),score=387.68 TRINITY_DN3326_c1_g2_i1:217-4119(+)
MFSHNRERSARQRTPFQNAVDRTYASAQTLWTIYWSGFLLGYKYVLNDLRRNKRNFLVGVSTILIVVCFVSLLNNAIQHSPVVFLKLAENQVGEFDLLMLPPAGAASEISNSGGMQQSGNNMDGPPSSEDDEEEVARRIRRAAGDDDPGSNTTVTTNRTTTQIMNAILASAELARDGFTLNETDIGEHLSSLDTVVGTTPRWTMLGRVARVDDPSRYATVIVLVIDSVQEQKIGLGRDWDRRPLGLQETYVTNSALREIGVLPAMGERVLVGVPVVALLAGLGMGADGGSDVDNFNDAYAKEWGNYQDKASQANGRNQEADVDVNKQATAALRGLARDAIMDALKNQTITIPANSSTLLSAIGVTDALPPAVLDQLKKALNTSSDITIDLSNLPPEAIDAAISELFPALSDDQDPFVSSSMECTVVDGVDDPQGKWPYSLGNVAVVESRFLPVMLQRALPANPDIKKALGRALLAPYIDDFDLSDSEIEAFDLDLAISSFPLNDFAMMVLGQYANRLDDYILPQKELDKKMIDFSNGVADALGIDYPVDMSLPLVTTLKALSYIRLFLDQIFNAVVVVLIGLGVMLIYSLLLSDVENKTYEYGMLRALGMTHTSLVELLVIQALAFSIPGVFSGLLLAWILNAPAQYAIAFFASTSPAYGLASTSIILAVTVGTIMPLISNVWPIKRALSRTLRDSLDVYHQSNNDTSVTIVKLDSLGLSAWQTSLSLMLVVIGFVIYYLIPYSFLFLNFGLFLSILNAILLGMVIGAAITATVLQPYLERVVLSCLLWGKEKCLHNLIIKSLAAHRNRNRKTALMFSVALAFIIFSGAMFTLQASSISDNVKDTLGSDILVFAPTWKYMLNTEKLRVFLEKELERGRESVVVDYSFITFPLGDSYFYSHGQRFMNIAGYPNVRVNLMAVGREYLNSVYNSFFITSEVDSEFKYEKVPTNSKVKDIIKSLYDDAGQARLPLEKNGYLSPVPIITAPESYALPPDELANQSAVAYRDYIDVVMSEAMRYALSVDVKSPLKMQIEMHTYEHWDRKQVFLAKARAMVVKLPGFWYSSYRETAYDSPLIITEDTFQRFLSAVYEQRWREEVEMGYRAANDTIDYPSVPPKQRLLVKLRPGATRDDREGIINGLRNFITDDTVFVFDTQAILATTDTATTLMLLFFNLVSAIACVLCFFLLWLSFTANVRENAWEFGVLRAVGLNTGQVIRTYIYESMSVIIAAMSMGIVIGLFIATTLQAQMNLFTEMPFQMNFPTSLISFVLITSLLVALVGSYLPASELRRKEIAIALRAGG